MVHHPALVRLPRGVSLAGTTFALGLLAGSWVGPGVSARSETASAAPLAPRTILNPRRPMPGIHPADVLRVIDGDTFEARVQVWPGIEITTKVRLRGIDAPELRARCPQERSKAEAARDGLQALLAEGGIEVTRVSLDKYGGAMTRATPDVSAAMLAKGFARPYDGGHRESWCTGL